jgi:protein-disulfide isomerase
MPVAYVGLAGYGLLLGLSWGRQLSLRRRRVLAWVALIGAAVSIGLLIYSGWVIQAWCAWCLVSGAAMLGIATASIMLLRQPEPVSGISPLRGSLLLVALALALLVQGYFMQQRAAQAPVAPEQVAAVSAAELMGGDNALGPANAPVVIVVFADLWCPTCHVAVARLQRFQKEHPRGLRLVYRHLPLWGLPGHETSRMAAALAEMAAEGERFWDYVAILHARKEPPTREFYEQTMARLGLDLSALEKRLADEEDPAVRRVLRDEDVASRLDLYETPVFFVSLNGQAPLAVSFHSLPDLLNSPEAVALLQAAQSKD